MEYINENLSPHTIDRLTDIEKKFVFMRASGSSIREISKKLNKSTNTICAWNKKFSGQVLLSRNKAFCELQKKVIDLKNSRIDFLKKEIERITKILAKLDMKQQPPFSHYDNLFGRFVKLSDTLTAYENDILSIGLNFKDNIALEADITLENTGDNNTVTSENNDVLLNPGEKTPEKTDGNSKEKQNRDTITLSKSIFYNKQ